VSVKAERVEALNQVGPSLESHDFH
jgi:hypothetical protein